MPPFPLACLPAPTIEDGPEFPPALIRFLDSQPIRYSVKPGRVYRNSAQALHFMAVSGLRLGRLPPLTAILTVDNLAKRQMLTRTAVVTVVWAATPLVLKADRVAFAV